jgi:hypothetical protein
MFKHRLLFISKYFFGLKAYLFNMVICCKIYLNALLTLIPFHINMINTTYTKTKPWLGRKKIMCTYHWIRPSFYLHKMIPWIEGKKITCTYHDVIVTSQWWSILLTQIRPWIRRGKIHGNLPPHDCCNMIMIDPTNVYTQWKHE